MSSTRSSMSVVVDRRASPYCLYDGRRSGLTAVNGFEATLGGANAHEVLAPRRAAVSTRNLMVEQSDDEKIVGRCHFNMCFRVEHVRPSTVHSTCRKKSTRHTHAHATNDGEKSIMTAAAEETPKPGHQASTIMASPDDVSALASPEMDGASFEALMKERTRVSRMTDTAAKSLDLFIFCLLQSMLSSLF